MDLKRPGDVNFALRDISGSLMSAQTMHFSKGRHQFMLSEIKSGGLKPGVYFLRADNQTGKAMLKLVKVK
jgi:hypothetical protein